MSTYQVSLGDISVDTEETNDQLMSKAQDFLPAAVRLLGEKAGLEAWKLLEDGFRNSPIELDSSVEAKNKFIRGATEEFVESISEEDRLGLLESIFDQLKQTRDAPENESGG